MARPTSQSAATLPRPDDTAQQIFRDTALFCSRRRDRCGGFMKWSNEQATWVAPDRVSKASCCRAERGWRRPRAVGAVLDALRSRCERAVGAIEKVNEHELTCLRARSSSGRAAVESRSQNVFKHDSFGQRQIRRRGKRLRSSGAPEISRAERPSSCTARNIRPVANRG